MIESSENPQNRICIYIANQKMIKLLEEMYPNAKQVCDTIWQLDTTITLQDNWIVNSFYGKPRGKYCKEHKMPIIRTGKQLLTYKLLILLEVPFDEINEHLLEHVK